MKLENSVESVKAAKKLLGMPEDARIGFQRVVDGDRADYAPVIEKDGKRWCVGDEVLPPREETQLRLARGIMEAGEPELIE